ncbi:MAG: aminotransferase class I/II-fold pyridoxal phosphate-dependent enzyme, partial [Candidatus Jordarchaeales archaeon]
RSGSVAAVLVAHVLHLIANWREVIYVEDSVAFAEELLKEEGVCVTPGKVFGLGGEGHVRISYAASMKSILEGVERIREFLSSMRR